MRVRILGCGTSTGVPLPGCSCAICTSGKERNTRLRASVFLTLSDGLQLLIDAGPDLRQQALRYGVTRIDSILFTHSHADHILGIDDLRAFNFIHKKAIPAYATQPTMDDIKKVFHYCFNPSDEYQGGLPARIDFRTIDLDSSFIIGDTEVNPFALEHGNIITAGYKIGQFAYATDCKVFSPRGLELVKGIECLVLDGLRHQEHLTHFTIEEAIEFSKSLGVKRTILTHMSHDVDYYAVSETLPDGVELAYDGMLIDI